MGPAPRRAPSAGVPVGPDTSSDSPGLARIPVFTARALDALSDLLEGRGEPLPLEVEGGGELYAFNATRLSDALDEERSDLKRFKAEGTIMRVKRFEFDPDRVAGETIFKLIQKRNYEFVTEPFRKRVEEAALRGFWFERVWSPSGATSTA